MASRRTFAVFVVLSHDTPDQGCAHLSLHPRCSCESRVMLPLSHGEMHCRKISLTDVLKDVQVPEHL